MDPKVKILFPRSPSSSREHHFLVDTLSFQYHSHNRRVVNQLQTQMIFIHDNIIILHHLKRQQRHD